MPTWKSSARTRARSWASAISLVVLLPARATRAADDDRVFFEVAGGGGLAWVDHPGVPSGEFGATWDVLAGLELAGGMSLAFAFTTWQSSFLGTPGHLHTVGARVELPPFLERGPYAFGGVGFGTDDGDPPKQAGYSGTLGLGYHLPTFSPLDFALEGGAHGYWFPRQDDPSARPAAIEPFLAVRARLYGATGTPEAEGEPAVRMFIGGRVGASAFSYDHPEVPSGAHPGVITDYIFGLELTPMWSLAIELDTSQDDLFGRPFHLHTFAPRIELASGRGDAPFVAASLGLGLTDGDVEKRAGLAGALSVGYRVMLSETIAVEAEGAGMTHVYPQGRFAFGGLVATHLRFYGTVLGF